MAYEVSFLICKFNKRFLNIHDSIQYVLASCRKCKEDEKSQFIYGCQYLTLMERRLSYLGSYIVEPGDIIKHLVTTLVNFIEETGLLSKK